MTMEKIFKTASNLGWDVEDSNDKVFFFKMYDKMIFKIEVHKTDTVEEFLKNLCDKERELDPSKEAYEWLDDTGHGKYGAPSEMGKVYEIAKDFKEEACLLRKTIVEVEGRKEFVLESMKNIKKIAEEVLHTVQRGDLSDKENKAFGCLVDFVNAMYRL